MILTMKRKIAGENLQHNQLHLNTNVSKKEENSNISKLNNYLVISCNFTRPRNERMQECLWWISVKYEEVSCLCGLSLNLDETKAKRWRECLEDDQSLTPNLSVLLLVVQDSDLIYITTHNNHTFLTNAWKLVTICNLSLCGSTALLSFRGRAAAGGMSGTSKWGLSSPMSPSIRRLEPPGWTELWRWSLGSTWTDRSPWTAACLKRIPLSRRLSAACRMKTGWLRSNSVPKL